MAADSGLPCLALPWTRQCLTLREPPTLAGQDDQTGGLRHAPLLARAFGSRSSHRGTSLLASGVGVAAALALETLEAREGRTAIRLSQLI